MIDWNSLKSAVLRDYRLAQQLGMIERIESWLDQPVDKALEQCDAFAVSESKAREVNEMLPLVRNVQRRALGIPEGVAGMERLQKLVADYRSGALTAQERRVWERFVVANGFGEKLQKRFPVIAEPPATDDSSLRAMLAALQQRQQDAQQNTVPGKVSIEGLNALEALLADYRTLLEAAASQKQIRIDVSFFAAHAAYALGRGWSLLGRAERAAQFYAEAGSLYTQAGAASDAARAITEARSLGFASRSDIDGASADDLRALIDGGLTAVAKARALARLSLLATKANAVYDAADYADKAAIEFGNAGLLDPEGCHFDTAFNSWIEASNKESTGGDADALQVLAEICGIYLAIFQARHASRISGDPAGAARCEETIKAVGDARLEAVAQAAQAQNDTLAKLAHYMPLLQPMTGVIQSNDDFERNKALLERLNAIQLEANAADANRDHAAATAFLQRTAGGVQEAIALGVPATIGHAYYIDAYVRLRAADEPGAVASTLAGESALLAGNPATPETLAGHPQFDLLLMLRGVRLQAVCAQRDDEGAHALSEDTVRLIEAQRYRINDPFEQGAFLAGRNIFYEMYALSSFKLQQWDDLLTAMELVKSRAILLNRLAPPGASDDSKLTLQLAEVNAKLVSETKESERLALIARRRLLVGLRAIERRRAAGSAATPILNVAAVQAALAQDEAAIAWVWIARDVFIVMAIDPKRVHAERVILSEGERALLDAYVTDLRGQIFAQANLDAALPLLVIAALPQKTLDFVADARRLILSPHRALHLLPFHTAKVGDRFLIEQAAVGYAPNLGSLLLPREKAPSVDGGLFAVGVNVFNVPNPPNEGLKDLANAEDEAEAVAKVWVKRGLPADVVTGPAATVADFRARGDRLAQYECLHLATHGASVFEKEVVNDPLASRLFLQDGAVDALAISQLRLRAEVVVLSACNSGQRALGGRGLDELPGDDMFGLAAAFFEAGAHSVIGALWPVYDKVAPLMMQTLHEQLAAGVAPDRALQQAMLAYLHRPDASRSLFVWAPLFLSFVGANA